MKGVDVDKSGKDALLLQAIANWGLLRCRNYVQGELLILKIGAPSIGALAHCSCVLHYGNPDITIFAPL